MKMIIFGFHIIFVPKEAQSLIAFFFFVNSLLYDTVSAPLPTVLLSSLWRGVFRVPSEVRHTAIEGSPNNAGAYLSLHRESIIASQVQGYASLRFCLRTYLFLLHLFSP